MRHFSNWSHLCTNLSIHITKLRSSWAKSVNLELFFPYTKLLWWIIVSYIISVQISDFCGKTAPCYIFLCNIPRTYLWYFCFIFLLNKSTFKWGLVRLDWSALKEVSRSMISLIWTFWEGKIAPLGWYQTENFKSGSSSGCELPWFS